MPNSINLSIRLPSIGNLQIYVDPRDQAKAQRLLDKQPEILRRAYRNGATEFANRVKRIVTSCINKGMPPPGQGVSWPPHSEYTKKKFGEHPLLKLTGQYARSIIVSQNRDGVVFVGVPSVRKQRPAPKRQSGTGKVGSSYGSRTLSQIAYILEVGSNHIPPRPLWRPAYQAAGGPKEVRKLMIKHIRREIRKEVGGIRRARV